MILIRLDQDLSYMTRHDNDLNYPSGHDINYPRAWLSMWQPGMYIHRHPEYVLASWTYKDGTFFHINVAFYSAISIATTLIRRYHDLNYQWSSFQSTGNLQTQIFRLWDNALCWVLPKICLFLWQEWFIHVISTTTTLIMRDHDLNYPRAWMVS